MYKVPLVFHRNYVSILYCFWDILCQIMAPLYRLHRSSYWHSTELRTYLVSFHCGPILYHFWDREILVKNRNFCHMTLCLVRPMPSRCVRLSVYRVCALYRNEYTYSQYGSPIILVFFSYKTLWQYTEGIEYRTDMKKIAIFYQYLALSRKGYKTEPQLQWQIYQMVLFSMTWLTPQGHNIVQCQQKWHKTGLYLQWKSYMISQMVPYSMTLNDP